MRNVGSTSKTLGLRCTNVIQMFCVCCISNILRSHDNSQTVLKSVSLIPLSSWAVHFLGRCFRCRFSLVSALILMEITVLCILYLFISATEIVHQGLTSVISHLATLMRRSLLQIQTAVTTHLKSKQLLLFIFA